jgi:hypothetical protein
LLLEKVKKSIIFSGGSQIKNFIKEGIGMSKIANSAKIRTGNDSYICD